MRHLAVLQLAWTAYVSVKLLQQCEVMLSYFTAVSRGLGANVFHSWTQLFTTVCTAKVSN